MPKTHHIFPFCLQILTFRHHDQKEVGMEAISQEHFSTDEDANLAVRAHTVGGVPQTDRMTPFLNIKHLLEHQTACHEEKEWLIFYPEEEPRRSVTFEVFFSLVRKTVQVLQSFGVRRGDRICVLSPNHPGTVVQYFAAWYLGAAIVPVDPEGDEKRIVSVMDGARVKLAFVRTRYIPLIARLKPTLTHLEIVIEAGMKRSSEFPFFHDELEKMDANITLLEEPRLSDDALIFYPSPGSASGEAVVLDQYNLLVEAMAVSEWHGMAPLMPIMCALPLHQLNGIAVSLLSSLYHGSCLVLLERFRPDTFYGIAEIEKIAVACIEPALLDLLLLERLNPARYDLSGFRYFICDAVGLTGDMARRYETAFGVPVSYGHGIAGTSGFYAFHPVESSPADRERWILSASVPSIGVTLPVCEMDIQAPDGSSLPEGERGEIAIRGHDVMKHFDRAPDANASAFRHGWFHTGEEGYFKNDEGGRKFYFVTGRMG
jgi:acyl-CoA synthetase (AMP-forming)/AMP-acid ligase II